MTLFRGRIEDENGKTVVDHVAGSFGHRVLPGSLTSWSGSVTLPTGVGLMPGAYRLVLNDGRSASIVVTAGSAGSSGLGIVQFKGNGPPP